MRNQNVGYYAVIPAGVRYDSHVCPNAKLLYGEVTALCNKEGYCWATNKYFAELYSVSIRTITNWVKQLTDNGYLESELIYKEGTKEIVARYLRLPTAAPHPKTPVPEQMQPEESPAPIENNFYTPMETGDQPPIEDFFYTPPENIFHTPIEKNFQYNNTEINNTSINILSFKNKAEGKKEGTDRQQKTTTDNSPIPDEPVLDNKGEVCPILDLSDLKLDEELRTVAEQVQAMVYRLWDISEITVKGKVCRQKYIRAQLSRLTAYDVLAVLEKFRQNRNKIKNLPSYFATMLLQAPDETSLWEVQKTGTATAAPAQSPSYDLEEWERQSLLSIQTERGH